MIIRFSINMSALTSPPPLCDVRRVNPRHFWSFIQGSNTLLYNLRTFWDHCYNVYSLGIKSFKPLSTPGLKGDPGRVTQVHVDCDCWNMPLLNCSCAVESPALLHHHNNFGASRMTVFANRFFFASDCVCWEVLPHLLRGTLLFRVLLQWYLGSNRTLL